MEKEKMFTVTVETDNSIDAYGAYKVGSVKDKNAIVIINLEANYNTSVEHDIPMKEMVVETIMHEVGHALEEWYDLKFDEDRIDRITQSYRELPNK